MGEFNATDPDGDAITYHLVSGGGDANNSLFTLDQSGTLKTAAILDYEAGSSLSIRVQAKDEMNATAEGNFTISLVDIFEDLDGDGIEDHLDEDMDGDGLPNVIDDDSDGDGFSNKEKERFPNVFIDSYIGMVSIYPKNPVSLGYPDYDEVNATIENFLIGKYDSYLRYLELGQDAALQELGWTLAQGIEGSGGSTSTNSSHPVTSISITNIYHWCNALSLLIGAEPCYFIETNNAERVVMMPGQTDYDTIIYDTNANGVRLPDGNEWEYAARGGLIQKPYPWGDGSASSRSNWTYSQYTRTTPVGTFDANGYGLYDMAGNAQEKVWDTGVGPSVAIPTTITTSTKHVAKGGGWNQGYAPKVTLGWGLDPWHNGHSNGFRIARTLQSKVVELNSTVSLEMLWVEPGTFTMGSPETEAGRSTDESEHNVTLSEGFYLGKYELTQAQYEAVMTGDTGGKSYPKQVWRAPMPVENLSYYDVQAFLTRLNELDQNNTQPGWAYVFPTEAEWEYAARAGSDTPYSWGNDINTTLANYDGYLEQTVSVGQYLPNAWGFFDMHGNVWERVADWYGPYNLSNQVDPLGPTTGYERVLRGGSWNQDASSLRSANRAKEPHCPG